MHDLRAMADIYTTGEVGPHNQVAVRLRRIGFRYDLLNC